MTLFENLYFSGYNEAQRCLENDEDSDDSYTLTISNGIFYQKRAVKLSDIKNKKEIQIIIGDKTKPKNTIKPMDFRRDPISATEEINNWFKSNYVLYDIPSINYKCNIT